LLLCDDNISIGHRAKVTNAYTTALRFFISGITLLKFTGKAWTEDYFAISKDLFMGCAESYIYKERTEIVDNEEDDMCHKMTLYTCHILLENLVQPEEKAQAYQLLILYHELRGNCYL
jgi:hypothetical protein